MKFDDSVNIDVEADSEIRHQLSDYGIHIKLPSSARIARLFRGATPAALRELGERASGQRPGVAVRYPNLLSHLSIQVDDVAEADEVLAVLRDPLQGKVRYAYVAPEVQLPQVTPNDEPEYPKQRYLCGSPEGIGAESAWLTPGGDGREEIMADVEAGWDMTHDDLAGLPVGFSHGAGSAEQPKMDHGNGVLGIVAARDNGKGVIGVAPNLAKVGLCSYIVTTPDGTEDRLEEAIPHAATTLASLGQGFVLLLEVSYSAVSDFNGDVWQSMPVEAAPAIHDIIRVATAAGVVVVEAAGNGTQELDSFLDVRGHAVFDLKADRFERIGLDSGAVLVAASTHGVYDAAQRTWERQRLNSSNWGRRVDCHAGGELLFTATSGNGFTSYFGGTSGATAVIGGVAVAMQGVSRQRRGSGLTPFELRNRLRDDRYGYAPSPFVRGAIGGMPDLEKLVSRL